MRKSFGKLFRANDTDGGAAGESYSGKLSKDSHGTTDGKGLTEHKAGESINAVQYLYYKAKVNGKDQMVLFGTREVTITVKQVNKENKIQKMEFDTSDAATGNSWTKAS